MKAGLTIAAATIAMSAAPVAHANSDTIADLKALVSQGAFKEAYLHLGDIPPAQRSADWVDVASSAAAGVLPTLSSDDGTTIEAIDQIDRDYPQLLKTAKYMRVRADLGLKGLAGCYAQTSDYWSSYGIANCSTLALRFIDNAGGDKALALQVAKLASRSMMAYSAVPFFKRALARDPAVCRDGDLQTAVVSGLGLEPEHAGDAKAMMTTCWDSVKDAVAKAFDADSPHGYVRQNTCGILKAKGMISGLQAKRC
ncbi:MAG TPA: hypothetical protein VHZ95_22575 [Polyangiales bacterium]|nr:hypothetical protein [Polyangiales bacterium]